MTMLFRARFTPVALVLAMLLAVAPAVHAKEPGLLDKVIAKKEIRCGYVVWPPMTIKDPNTGRISGVFTDIMEKAGANAGLKIVWAGEASYGTAIEDMKTGKYDMICSVIWPNTPRAMHASFSVPLSYSAIEAFVRADETRIKKLSDIDNPDVTISTIDGEAAEAIARQDFPKAKRGGLPQNTDTAQLYSEMVGKKTDVVLHDLLAARDYTVHNPGKIKRLAPGKPLRVYANSYMLPKGEEEFRGFLNVALQELLDSGYVAQVIKKYGLQEGVYPVAKPYAGE